LQQECNRYGYIIGGVDWLGMCEQDVPFVSEMITLNLTDFPMIPDRLHQGMLDALFLMKLMLSPLFMDNDVFSFGNYTIVNPKHRNYYGNSLGGIMGSVYMTLSTDVTHGVLGVPGFPFELMLPRSCDFTPFEDILKARYETDVGRILLVSLIQLLWNRLEPAGYLHHMSMDPFPNTPVHTVIIHYGLGDAQVTWLSAEQMARAINASMFISNVAEYNETLFGFPFIEDSAIINTTDENMYGHHLIQGWNYNEPPVPWYNKPPDCDDDTHEYTRRQYDSQEAIHAFFTQDVIYNACDGPCNGTPTK